MTAGSTSNLLKVQNLPLTQIAVDISWEKGQCGPASQFLLQSSFGVSVSCGLSWCDVFLLHWWSTTISICLVPSKPPSPREAWSLHVESRQILVFVELSGVWTKLWLCDQSGQVSMCWVSHCFRKESPQSLSSECSLVSILKQKWTQCEHKFVHWSRRQAILFLYPHTNLEIFSPWKSFWSACSEWMWRSFFVGNKRGLCLTTHESQEQKYWDQRQVNKNPGINLWV